MSREESECTPKKSVMFFVPLDSFRLQKYLACEKCLLGRVCIESNFIFFVRLTDTSCDVFVEVLSLYFNTNTIFLRKTKSATRYSLVWSKHLSWWRRGQTRSKFLFKSVSLIFADVNREAWKWVVLTTQHERACSCKNSNFSDISSEARRIPKSKSLIFERTRALLSVSQKMQFVQETRDTKKIHSFRPFTKYFSHRVKIFNCGWWRGQLRILGNIPIIALCVHWWPDSFGLPKHKWF